MLTPAIQDFDAALSPTRQQAAFTLNFSGPSTRWSAKRIARSRSSSGYLEGRDIRAGWLSARTDHPGIGASTELGTAQPVVKRIELPDRTPKPR